MLSRNISKGKHKEETEQFVAFDYLPVINCHYSVIGDSNNSLNRWKNNGIDFSSRDSTSISLLNSLHGYQFSYIFENRISLFPLFGRIIQVNTLLLPLPLCLASLRGKSLTYFSILAYQAFSILFVAVWHVSGCHYLYCVNIFLRQIEFVNVTGIGVN